MPAGTVRPRRRRERMVVFSTMKKEEAKTHGFVCCVTKKMGEFFFLGHPPFSTPHLSLLPPYSLYSATAHATKNATDTDAAAV